LALLRTLGAGRGQVFRSVLAGAAAVGTVGALAGALLGIGAARGLAALLSAFGLSLPVTGLVIPLAQVALGCAVALATTVTAALAPAYRGTRVAPVQALRDAGADGPAPAGRAARRLAAALVLGAGGAAMLLTGLLAGAGLAITAAGAGLVFL